MPRQEPELISLLTPSRGRPEGLQRFIDSALDLADEPSKIEHLVGLDHDDNKLEEYQKKIENANLCLFNALSTVSQIWNTLAEHSRGSLLMMGNDDLVFREKSWDTALRERAKEFPDRIFCLWFLDGIATIDSWPRFPCVSREWYETLGYFAPTVGFRFFCNDTWIGDLANRVDRSILVSDIQYLDHLHHTRTGIKDETTKRARRNNANKHDLELFAKTEDVRREDAKKLMEKIQK